MHTIQASFLPTVCHLCSCFLIVTGTYFDYDLDLETWHWQCLGEPAGRISKRQRSLSSKVIIRTVEEHTRPIAKVISYRLVGPTVVKPCVWLL